MSSPSSGCVYIVGAGPGDPSLLTVKGAHCLRQADVLLYDELLNHRLLDLADPTCEKIYVGKQGGRRSHSQEEINALLLSKGSEGKKVVRLKGGDPCIYGRGAEEAMQLAAAGIRFEIVPGISAAAA
ncbi:MAG: HemD protein, partial [Gemmatimonadetes bacterium]|nr:HemD protein [Gemmatimonadota bacterium]